MAVATLNLRQSVLSGGGGWINNFWGYKTAYRRSIRMVGGYWQASWEFDTLSGMSVADLRQWFYEFLGYHIVESIGSLTTWEGMLYEMELIENGVHRVKSLDLMSNAIKTAYTDSDDDENPAETTWNTHGESVKRYGRKEKLLTVNNCDSTFAESYRDTVLKIEALPWARPTGSSEPKQPILKCKALGYIHTLNWRHITAVLDAGAEGNLSDYLTEILDTDCEFVSPQKIATNTTQVIQTVDYELCWDWIKEKVELGDGIDPWYFQVVNDRKAVYDEIDWTPRYYWRSGQLYDSIGSKQSINPYLVKPAVCRDMAYTKTGKEYGSPYQDRRDFILEEVEVGERSGIKFKTLEFDEGEFMAGFDEYQHWLVDSQFEGESLTKSKPGKWSPWGKMSDEEREKFLEMKRKKAEEEAAKKQK